MSADWTAARKAHGCVMADGMRLAPPALVGREDRARTRRRRFGCASGQMHSGGDRTRISDASIRVSQSAQMGRATAREVTEK